MWSRYFLKNALFPPPLTIAIENVVHLEKNTEMSPIKDEFLAGYSKQNKTFDNFGRKLKKLSFFYSLS